MRASRMLLVAVGSVALFLGCNDECERLPPSFQLDIRSTTGVGSIEVTLDLPDERRSRTFNLPNGELDDGETSLAVNLGSSRTADFEVGVAVTAYSGENRAGGVIAAGQDLFTAQPNGCNLFDLELELGATPQDAGTADTGVAAECSDGCDSANCNPNCPATCDSCDLNCTGSSSCDPRCDEEQCNVVCGFIASCDTRCSSGSNCDITCGRAIECKARCTNDAHCLLRCDQSLDCGYEDCNGGETQCSDGSIACNRDCP